MRARQTLRDCFSTYSSDVDEDKLDTTVHVQETLLKESVNPSRRLSLLSVLTGVISSFLSGYRLGVVNEPLESISLDLGFNGNSLAEGLVVTTCLGGTFLGFMLENRKRGRYASWEVSCCNRHGLCRSIYCFSCSVL
ncbi:probable plastidic glucose transporter 3 [Papaver somniferum]|uniref:probable plastidic glucose transporter 3 n=1 Tax=Papaver somniferum TaxID=3469 RepID=UPI000E6FAD18|nr:probable plastidic glucose transporter 3 [Papaver somniferum]